LNSLYLVFERGFTGIRARQAHGYPADTVAARPEFERAPSVGAVSR
jgi:hypothetical protein